MWLLHLKARPIVRTGVEIEQCAEGQKTDWSGQTDAGTKLVLWGTN